MSFGDILNDALMDVRGAQLAGIISADGLGVDLVAADSAADRDTLGLELGEVAAAITGAGQRLNTGSVRDFMLEAEKSTYVASQVMPGYYAVIAVEPDAHLGRARYAAKQMARRLQTEL